MPIHRRAFLAGAGAVAGAASLPSAASAGPVTSSDATALIIHSDDHHAIEAATTETYESVHVYSGGQLSLGESAGLELGRDEAAEWWSPYTNENGAVDTDGLRVALGDWREDTLDTTRLRDLLDWWRTEEPVPN